MTKSIAVLLTTMLSLQLYSQSSSVSPYSAFGPGDIKERETVENMGMSGLGTVYSSTYRLNFTNPAGYADLQLVTYTLGISNNNVIVKSKIGMDRASSIGMDYLAMGIPIGKFGLGFGLAPHSSVGYSIVDRSDDKDQSRLYQFEGSGGINRVFVALGYAVNKHLNIGIEGEYLFGNNKQQVTWAQSDVQLASRQRDNTKISGFNFNSGIQFKKTWRNSYQVRAGATYTFSGGLNAENKRQRYTFIVAPSGAELGKSILSDDVTKTRFKMAQKMSLGIGYGKPDKWFTAFEYIRHDDSGFEKTLSNTAISGDYKKSVRYNLGGFYIPKFNSISNYFSRVVYRSGIHLRQTDLYIEDDKDLKKINDFGISFGVGLPVNIRSLSNVNVTLNIGQRGAVTENLLKENYFNLHISLSLNDRWFLKRKID